MSNDRSYSVITFGVWFDLSLIRNFNVLALYYDMRSRGGFQL